MTPYAASHYVALDLRNHQRCSLSSDGARALLEDSDVPDSLTQPTLRVVDTATGVHRRPLKTYRRATWEMHPSCDTALSTTATFIPLRPQLRDPRHMHWWLRPPHDQKPTAHWWYWGTQDDRMRRLDTHMSHLVAFTDDGSVVGSAGCCGVVSFHRTEDVQLEDELDSTAVSDSDAPRPHDGPARRH
ncbi:uncharacterized protein BXZ73DRAFT_102196 [Epithele typhae]|uniref:uncharacterized protein n=1 Tax=Epithele typhae TaxID=378194 RepID=UPI002008E255|nr:uncharacterized protein BXZ73DRAFT_102196 [Epithele typhae]KAH9929044.1 hypothetical protein BXZ73DRAFT_102196 [Epithele typhae]